VFFESVSTPASHSETELLSDVMHSQTLTAHTWTCFDHQHDYNIHGTVEFKHDALWFDMKVTTKTTYKFGILLKFLLSYIKPFYPQTQLEGTSDYVFPVTCVLKTESHKHMHVHKQHKHLHICTHSLTRSHDT